MNDYRIKYILFHGVFEFRTRHPATELGKLLPIYGNWNQIIIICWQIAIRLLLFCPADDIIDKYRGIVTILLLFWTLAKG